MTCRDANLILFSWQLYINFKWQCNGQILQRNEKKRIKDCLNQADRASVEKKLEKKLASAQIPARTKAQRKVSFGYR